MAVHQPALLEVVALQVMIFQTAAPEAIEILAVASEAADGHMAGLLVRPTLACFRVSDSGQYCSSARRPTGQEPAD